MQASRQPPSPAEPIAAQRAAIAKPEIPLEFADLPADPSNVPDPIQALQQTLDRLDEIEQELSAVRLDLRQSDRLATLGQVTATIAHEVNNILTPALSYAQLAKKQPDRPDLVQKALDRTIEGVSAASEILDAALNLAAGDARSCPNTTRPKEALASAIKCLAREPERDGIDLRVAIPDDFEAPIPPRALQQVFMNLLTNATRILRRQGGGRITVTCTHTPGRTRITFADNGPGIPDDMRPTLFQPFTTTEAVDPSAPQEGGRGLGLSICRRTVTSHGGSIGIGDAADGSSGACFVIEFDRAASEESGRLAA